MLLEKSPRLGASNSRVTASRVGLLLGVDQRWCQGGQFIPAEVERLVVYAAPLGSTPATLQYEVFDSAGVLRDEGRTGTISAVGAAAGRLSNTRPDIERGRLCVTNAGPGALSLAGNLTAISPEAPPAVNGPAERATDEIRVDFFRGGQESASELFGEIARRYALFRPDFVGEWTLPALFAVLMLSAVASIIALIRATPRSIAVLGLHAPVQAIVCAALMFVVASCWALLTPTFQGPDEPAHAGYAQYVGEFGQLPSSVAVSNRREAALEANTEHYKLFRSLPFNVEGTPSWSGIEDAALDNEVRRTEPLVNVVAPGSAANGPPLFYLPAAAISAVMADAGPTNRLFAMRILSAIMASATVYFVYLFTQIAIGDKPVLATAASLAVVYQPMFGFLSGSVINDNLMVALASALLYTLARVFRDGLTVRRAFALGALLGLGDLAKTRMILLLPGVAVALAIVCWRSGAWPARLIAMRRSMVGAGVFTVIEGGYVIAARTVLMRGSSIDRVTATSAGDPTSILGRLSYTWQYFLPKLPFMADQFTTYPQYGVWQVYVQGFIGRFGWFQYGFSEKVNLVGLVVLVSMGLLGLRTLTQHQSTVNRRRGEVAAYSSIVLVLLVLIGFTGYSYRAATGYSLEQTRYLFPCIALYGAWVALVIGGFRPQWRSAGAVAIVSVAASHTFFSMVLTVDRYYL